MSVKSSSSVLLSTLPRLKCLSQRPRKLLTKGWENSRRWTHGSKETGSSRRSMDRESAEPGFKCQPWESPGSPVVRTQRFHCCDLGSIRGWGIQIPQMMRHSPPAKKTQQTKHEPCNLAAEWRWASNWTPLSLHDCRCSDLSQALKPSPSVPLWVPWASPQTLSFLKVPN